MQVIITGKKVKISQALQSYVAEKLEKINDKYTISPLETTVVLSKIGHRHSNLFRADISTHIGKGVNIRCYSEANDGYNSFDLAAEILSSKLRKYKNRLKDFHRHHDVNFREQKKQMASHFVLGSSKSQKDILSPPVIAEMKTEIPTLTVGDAVMKMDLSEDHILLFRNISSNSLNIIYRRKDGNIGWIDPDILEKS